MPPKMVVSLADRKLWKRRVAIHLWGVITNLAQDTRVRGKLKLPGRMMSLLTS